MSQLELKHCIQCTELKEITKFKNQYTKKEHNLEKDNVDVCIDCEQMKRLSVLIKEYKKLCKMNSSSNVLMR